MLGKQWHCVECWGGRELQVLVEMRALQLDTFLPLYQPKPDAVLEPAFPGYVFVYFDHADPAWRSIHGRPGVIQLLQHDPERPMTVADHVMRNLIETYGADGSMVDAGKRAEWGGLKLGAWVRVLDGPLASFSAKLLEDNGDRVKVAVEIFGRSSECEMPRYAIAPA